MNNIYVEGTIRGVQYNFIIQSVSPEGSLKLEDFDSVMSIIDLQRDIAFAEHLRAAREDAEAAIRDRLRTLFEAVSAADPQDVAPAEKLEDGTARCERCDKVVTVNQDGTLRAHGPKASRCGSAPATPAVPSPEVPDASEVTTEPAVDPGAAEDWFADPADAATSVDDLAKAVF